MGMAPQWAMKRAIILSAYSFQKNSFEQNRSALLRFLQTRKGRYNPEFVLPHKVPSDYKAAHAAE